MPNDVKPVNKVQVHKFAAPPALSSIVASRALEAEDEFRPYYADDALGAGMSLIEPPYNPAILQTTCSENNTLGPCIDAMEVNIDGTGYLIENSTDTSDKEDPTIVQLQEFFDEVFPGLSMTQLRRRVRRDLEQTGNGYIEVLRNAQGKVMFLRYIPSRTIRIMRLDAPIVIEKTVMRFGEPVTIPTLIRERRFAQMIGAVWIYFREFGSARQINYETGWWDSEVAPVPFSRRGTEVIHLKINDHYFTPYGLPRWEGQIPSVLGSRRAEEYNLDYFETGGLPPALVTITGGSMTEDARKSLEQQFNSKDRAKHRIAILEVQSTSGSLDDAGKVAIAIERFGSDREHDAMFQGYDDKCHLRVRRSFRLPPLFVGDVDKMNFACYSADTETLTDRGWVTWDKFEPGMQVATVDLKSRSLRFQTPIGDAPLVYDVTDVQMHHLSNSVTDILVTPKHRMVYSPTPVSPLRIEPIEDMLTHGRVYGIDTVRDLQSIANSPETVLLACGIKSKLAPLLGFLGIFVSEGCTSLNRDTSGRARVVQKKPTSVPRVEKLMHAFECSSCVPVYRHKTVLGCTTWEINDTKFVKWLREETGVLSHNKKLPRWSLDLPRASLQVLFDALMLGDGSWDTRLGRTGGHYATTSTVLADQFQELAFKLGYRASIVEDAPGSYGDRNVFNVRISKVGRTQMATSTIKRVAYTGKVYCFSVPDGVFVTRRKGKIAIQGNTAYTSFLIAENQVFRPERLLFDDMVNRLLMPELNGDGYLFRSKNLSVADIQTKLAALQVAAGTQHVDPIDMITAINEIADLDIRPTELPVLPPPGPAPAEPNIRETGFNQAGGPGSTKPKVAVTTGTVKPPASPMQKSDVNILTLADEITMGLRKKDLGSLKRSLMKLETLSPGQVTQFKAAMALRSYFDPSIDPEGMSELAGCSMMSMASMYRSGELD